jgi:CheY-like chemotaxis protein
MGDVREGIMFETMEIGEANTKTILVVEDSPTQALHVQGLLEREGLNVALASDGLEGVRLARRLHPDLIVLDMQMPKMNGFQVCEQLKCMQETIRIPVIMFTRHDDPEMIALGLQSGIVDYIPKDAFADAVLLETLRQMGLIVPCAVEMV